MYSRTQRAPVWSILALVGLVLLVIAWLSAVPGYVQVILVVVAVPLLLLAACFASLTVEDRGELLQVRYGPVPLFRFRFPYRDITSVTVARSGILDGWGIHYLPGRGWIYNLWGFDCVRFRYRDRPVRVGTADVEGLAAFLREKTAPAPGPESSRTG